MSDYSVSNIIFFMVGSDRYFTLNSLRRMLSHANATGEIKSAIWFDLGERGAVRYRIRPRTI